MTEQKQSKCPKCKRLVSVNKDGTLCTHGPGPEDEDGICPFICPGSGDKGMVKAAKNLKV